MKSLSDTQFEQLSRQLQESGLQKQGLYHDLLDHYACLTEQFLREGIPFEEASEKALDQLAPQGFKSIENDLIYLLTFHFQITMKRFLFAGGFASTFVLLMSLLFKILHWPYANFLQISGLLSLLILAFPVLIVNLRSKSSPEKTRITLGMVSTLLLCTGFLFKTMHWIGANASLVLGFAVLCFAFLPLFFWQLYQNSVKELAK